ncbi:protein serine/threonine phosphatase 2C [Trichodelitschia bisporula]|uniref:Protein serine/threonine phosphatase 2C n=1 Tax=Trichodelitschia bisporula TaxID=703511 RepID=A0A6G1HT37_9PEZI|nr:protein serine/threonine phosphatase 2C [Trichodelitschia bisporula]
MQLPRLTLALATAALVGSGAWYYQSRPFASVGDVTDAPNTEEGMHRKALVIGGGQVFAVDAVGDGPLPTVTDDGRKVLRILSPEQATEKLRSKEESWLIGRGNGVLRYDVVQLGSNEPIEDDHAEQIIEHPQGTDLSDWMFWGVFDGHSGWTTSAKLRKSLISSVARQLNATYPAALESAMKTGFVEVDNDIIHGAIDRALKAKTKAAATELLAPALSGSCALLSFYDSNTQLLRVAVTGDSRAVLGRKGANGKWSAVALSVDQTGGTKSEADRLRAEHPGEPQVVMHGRVLGRLEPTRAFGDAIYKWTVETQEKLQRAFFTMRTMPKGLKTPPYVTAEPVVTTTKVDPGQGDFLVLATDGLWEMLSNEEVVGLVGMWVEEQRRQREKEGQGSSWAKASWLTGNKGDKAQLPVESAPQSASEDSGQRGPFRQSQWGLNGGSAASRFVVKDKNVATHLVRNALGGRDEDQLCSLLTIPSPMARRFRDDLTVQVIFFGEGEGDAPKGKVVLSHEASAPSEPVKAKL